MMFQLQRHWVLPKTKTMTDRPSPCAWSIANLQLLVLAAHSMLMVATALFANCHALCCHFPECRPRSLDPEYTSPTCAQNSVLFPPVYIMSIFLAFKADTVLLLVPPCAPRMNLFVPSPLSCPLQSLVLYCMARIELQYVSNRILSCLLSMLERAILNQGVGII